MKGVVCPFGVGGEGTPVMAILVSGMVLYS